MALIMVEFLGQKNNEINTRIFFLVELIHCQIEGTSSWQHNQPTVCYTNPGSSCCIGGDSEESWYWDWILPPGARNSDIRNKLLHRMDSAM
ncbi:hypothetical protein MKX01_022467 [Papaver californicum]|nr:hypothetical protein MKX01_022467 [Papaver californicum]